MNKINKTNRQSNHVNPVNPVDGCPEISEAEAAAMAANEPKLTRHVDVETLRAYDAYLRDWRWNMSTHIALQREYMGRRYAPRSENLY